MPDYDHVIPGGLILDFFPPEHTYGEKLFESADPDIRARALTRKALRILMMGWQDADWEGLDAPDMLETVFLKKNPQMIRAMHAEFQAGLYHVFTQLEGKTFTPEEELQAQIYLSNLLCILPFTGLNPYQPVEIPQLVNGAWQMVQYEVTPIELTPTTGLRKALYVYDIDRVFAYGLEPVNCADALPHILFKGTTYPADEGHFWQMYTNLEGFQTPGYDLYENGRERITAFLDKQMQQGKKTCVEGMSQGGILSLLLKVDQGEKVGWTYGLNASGLFDSWFVMHRDRWDELSEEDKKNVYITSQGDDWISSVGVLKKEWNFFKVWAPDDKKGPNSLVDHALNYAGFSETRFEPVENVEAENNSRTTRNNLLYVMRGLAYYSTVVPVFYVIFPILRYMWYHPMQTLLVAGALLLPPYLPPLAAMLLMGAAAFITAFYLVETVVNIVACVLGMNEVTPIDAHREHGFFSSVPSDTEKPEAATADVGEACTV